MKKIVSLMVTMLLTLQCIMAQLAEGIKFLNYERYKSGRELLKKAYDANSKDPQTIYWYGISLLSRDAGMLTKADVEAAKAVYQKGLQEIGSDSWLLVGMGHIDLINQVDINTAKQKFEQAITASTATKGKMKGKPDAGILNAIGRANASGDSKMGDPAYGIEKLKQAATIDLTDPDIYINMGVCYLKMGGENGGEAVKAYQEAIARDPKNARAMYRIGRIYQSQNNKELFEQFYNNAIAADPAFAPVYYRLYEYYSNKDVGKAKEYLDLYVTNADKDPLTDLFVADYLFRAGKYAESIAKAKEIEASVGGISNLPKLNVVFAYNYDRSNDSVQAKKAISDYMSKVSAEVVKGEEYELAVKIFTKFPGEEDAAASYIEKAMQFDTLMDSRAKYSKMAADLYQKAKRYKEQLVWLKKGAGFKKQQSITDYYYITDASIKAGVLEEASKLSSEMIQKFPDQIYGYRFGAQVAIAMDTDTSKGTAVPAVQQYIDFLAKDSVKYMKLIKSNYYYIAVYYADKVKDFAKALEICDRILALDPEDVFAKPAKEQLTKAMTKPASPTKPAGTKQTSSTGATTIPAETKAKSGTTQKK